MQNGIVYAGVHKLFVVFKKIVSLSRYLRAVKLPPQNSGGAKKLGGSPAACKRPIGEG
ncbi:hypothetical protein [Bacillus mycoides]|uniref:hypothetical protein n=1 Tax=Bacillus mycoides TaxID=1405 RepID=UPI001FF156BB|nr:hypothetical protein [Bacillus mycoides]MCQ6356557.1 hypothetical protein [Bacillus cereus]